MHKRLFSILTALVALSLITAPAFAGPKGHFNGPVSFSLGESLTASGVLAGYGNIDVIVELVGSGIGEATCTNKGGNDAPGQNPIQVEVSGIQEISASLIENGSAPFTVVTDAPPFPSAREAGCPNNNWKVTDLFVFWTNAVITVTDAVSGEVLLRQEFTCVTSGPPNESVSCTPVP